jgi:hypothetical protein
MIDGTAAADGDDLPVDLVLDGLLHVAEGVQVLDLDLHPQCLGTGRPHRDVGVAAQTALFHIAVVDLDRHEDGAEPGEELRGIGGRPEVRLGDDFDQRHAAAVEVEVGAGAGIGEPVVERLAGVLFHVDPGDPDAARAAAGLELHGAAGRQRPIVLGDLIALGQVRIEVVLAREHRRRLHRAAERMRRPHRELDGALVQDRQRSRQSQADRADVGVRG